MSLPTLPGGVPDQVPYLRLPRADRVFVDRAARLLELADNHVSGEWLRALALLCHAQHLAAEALVLPGNGVKLTGEAPLDPDQWLIQSPRSDGWRVALQRILVELRAATLPSAARAAIARLQLASAEQLDSWVAAFFTGEGERVDAAGAPFLHAALQVYWTKRAERIDPHGIARRDFDCPVCSHPATAGVIEGDDKVRYLTCSLCSTAWHRVRMECCICGTSGQLRYLTLEAGAAQSAEGCKAEACSECLTYLKLFYREQRPAAEPMADDAATMALDLLLSEDGYARGGVNLLVGG